MINRLAADLRAEFPDQRGWSRSNLHYMRALAEAWPDAEVVPQAVGQLPWGHVRVLVPVLAVAVPLPLEAGGVERLGVLVKQPSQRRERSGLQLGDPTGGGQPRGADPAEVERGERVDAHREVGSRAGL